MSGDRDPYSRVYWSIQHDEKFDGIREDMRLIGSWVTLLVLADQAYPGPAYIPPIVHRFAVAALVKAGLIDELPGRRFRVHGLDAERRKRSDSARNAAASRWHSERNAEPMLVRGQGIGLDEAEVTPNPAERGNPRSEGTNPRALGTNPRAIAARAKAAADAEREARRLEVRAIRQRYYNGEVTEAQMDALIANVGKEPDDLTRRSVSA